MSGDSVPAQAPLVVNGWSIYAHPLFLDQLEELHATVDHRAAEPLRVDPAVKLGDVGVELGEQGARLVVHARDADGNGSATRTDRAIHRALCRRLLQDHVAALRRVEHDR